MRELEMDFHDPVYDPLEPYNRMMFRFNDAFYARVATPVSRGYAEVVEEKFRRGISNFFHNLSFPGRLINNLLQGRPVRGAKEVAGFVVNTTFGFGGLVKASEGIPALDPAPPEKDVDTTLSTWGVGHGIYIVWPIRGPSTLRSSAAMVGDSFLYPPVYLEPDSLRWGVSAGETMNELPGYMNMYQNMEEFGLEPYSAVRDGYVQHRESKARR